MPLTRSISALGLLFTSVSAMVGSGWLFGSLYAAQIAGPASIFSWIIGGLLLLIIALPFAELSTAIPLAGGITRYTQFTHGSTVSFCMGWLAWLSCVSVAPTEAQAILQYAANFYPKLVQATPGVAPVLTTYGLFLAYLLLLFFTTLNLMAVRWVIRCNNSLTWLKLLIPLIVAGVLLQGHFTLSNFTSHDWMPYGWQSVLWSLPTAGIVFSFLGFRECISMAGETQNPQRAIPIALFGSVLLCILLYLLIQIAFIGALDNAHLVNGWNKLHFVGDVGPFAGITMKLGLSWLLLLIYVGALISPMGSAIVYTMSSARLNYGMSANKQLPAIMMGLDKQGVPVYAIFANFLVGCLMLIPLGTWQALVSFQSTAIVLSYGVGPICLLALRKQHPQLPRPFRLHYHRAIASLGFYACNLVAYWTGWDILSQIGISLGAGFLLMASYRLVSQRGQTMALHLTSAWWLIPYFLGISLISYLGNFGHGKGYLTFGWDFLIIALFSEAILRLAVHTRNPADAVCKIIDNAIAQDDHHLESGQVTSAASIKTPLDSGHHEPA